MNIEQNDEYWVERYLAGEASAFDQLVRRTQGRLYSTILRIVGSKDEALDVLQETYIKIFRNIHRFEHGSTFSTWSYRIAVNQSISHKRKRRFIGLSLNQNHQDDASDGYELDPQDPASGESNLERLAREERNRLVERALASLPPAQRAVLVMCDYDELKYEEIAAVLKVPIGTVRSRIHRAREELRKRLLPILNDESTALSDHPSGIRPEAKIHRPGDPSIYPAR